MSFAISLRDRLLKIFWGAITALLVAPWFFGSIVVGHLVRENFPFSHWPMYGNFHKQSYYVFIADGAGKPIASRDFNETTPRIGRQYAYAKKSEIARAKAANQTETKEELEQISGAKMLARMARRLSPEQFAAYGGLQLIEVKLQLEADRTITSHPRVMARIHEYPAGVSDE